MKCSSRIHWIPIECYSNPALAKRTIEADVWAFATTLFEIFTYGTELKSSDHRQIIPVSFSISAFVCYHLLYLFLVLYFW